MNINRTNYEQYLIDYLEGKLGKQDEAAVKLFLSENPDLSEEFSFLILSQAVLGDSKLSINKDRLLKSFSNVVTISKQNFEEFCIAYYEGDLDATSTDRLKNYLQKNPEFQSLFDLYGKILLKADQSIRYSQKKQLKKVQVLSLRRTIYYVSAGVAAAVALLILWFSWPDTHQFNSDQTTKISEIKLENTTQSTEQEAGKNLVKEIKSVIKTFDNEKTYTGEELAAVDSSDTRRQDKIVLASLSPLSLILENKIVWTDPETPVKQDESPSSGVSDQKGFSEKQDRKIRWNSIIPSRREILFDAMNLSIKGFNTLTENQLALRTNTNDKGKLTEIGIDGENFEFIRKTQRNTQN